jgi:hypothetical protein
MMKQRFLLLEESTDAYYVLRAGLRTAASYVIVVSLPRKNKQSSGSSRRIILLAQKALAVNPGRLSFGEACMHTNNYMWRPLHYYIATRRAT